MSLITGNNPNYGIIAQPGPPALNGWDLRALDNFVDKAIALKAKIESYLEHIFHNMPSGITDVFKQNCILSGSSISSIYHNETPKDYDMWVHDEEMIVPIYDSLVLNWSDYIANYHDIGYTEVPNSKVITNNAITLINNVQFIRLGTYKEQRKTFDYIHCLPYYDLTTQKFYISSQQMDSIAKKKLVEIPNGNKASIRRFNKFKERGWSY